MTPLGVKHFSSRPAHTVTVLEMCGGDRGAGWQNPALWLSSGETIPGDGRTWGNLGDVFRNHPSKHRYQFLIVSLLGWALTTGRLTRAFPLIKTSWINTDLNVDNVFVLSWVWDFPLLHFFSNSDAIEVLFLLTRRDTCKLIGQFPKVLVNLAANGSNHSRAGKAMKVQAAFFCHKQGREKSNCINQEEESHASYEWGLNCITACISTTS